MRDLTQRDIALMYLSYAIGRLDEKRAREREELERETLEVLMRKRAELEDNKGSQEHIDLYV